MEELKKIVAANLTALRTAKGMTQLELGEMISYSDKAISKWERGESIPDAFVLLKLSRIFGCTVDYLLTEHGEEEKPMLTAQKSRTNHLTLSLVTIIGIWMLALLVFVVLMLAKIVYPMIFMYAVIVSLIVLLVFSALWGKRLYNLIIISALVWSVLFAVYLNFLIFSLNFWQIIVLGIPAQLIVILCFQLRRSNKT